METDITGRHIIQALAYLSIIALTWNHPSGVFIFFMVIIIQYLQRIGDEEEFKN